jgi:C4-dicarboxylate-binding protein DctP
MARAASARAHLFAAPRTPARAIFRKGHFSMGRMASLISRRAFTTAAVAALATPAICRRGWAADEPLTLRCSLETVPSHARNVTIRDYLAKIEAGSGGRIKTQLFESGQLFPDLRVGTALLQGQVDMAVPGTWSLTGIVPDADLFQLPALYGQPIDVIHRVADGKPSQLLAAQLEHKLNAHVLGAWLDLGFFNWYTTGRPLTGYADLKGLKIRNAGGAGQAWRTQFMGAVPNTTPLPNVPLALSQGTFDGLITSNETIASQQFWESGIRYGLEDHQFMAIYVPMVSIAFWRKLSLEDQGMMTDLWSANIQTYRANMAASQARSRDVVQAHGIKLLAPPADEIAALRLRMLAEQDAVAHGSKISPEMVAAVMEEVAAGYDR